MLHTNHRLEQRLVLLCRFTHVRQRCVRGSTWGEHQLEVQGHSWALSGGQSCTIYVRSCGCKLNLCLVDSCQCIPETGVFLCFCVRCAFILFHISSALHKPAAREIQKGPGLEVPRSTKHTTRARQNHRFKQ